LRGIEDVPGVLLRSTELVLNALLVQAGITRKVGLLCVNLVLDLLLGELGRLVVVLEQQVAIGIADVLCQRVLGILDLLVVGRTAKRPTLRELCS
jgi:hypothetical protein